MNNNRLLSFVKRKIRQKRSILFWYSKDPFIPMDPVRKKRLLQNGFLPSDDLIFDFQNYPKELFINERDYQKIRSVNGPMNTLIDYKFYLPLIFQGNQDLLPEFFAYTSKDKIIIQRGKKIPTVKVQDLLFIALSKYKKLVLKPSSGSGGKGIIILTELNVISLLPTILNKDWVINNYLENEVFFHNIFPDSLNTTRVVFFKNSFGKNEILVIAQRFGNSLSKNIDNVHVGGMGCAVDLKTGQLSKCYSYINDKHRGWFSKHMDTNRQIEGEKIPDWNSKFSKIKNLIENDLDFLEYGGIDLAFTTSGIKIIEINSKPGVQLMQVGGPALLNLEFSNFLKLKGFKPILDNRAFS